MKKKADFIHHVHFIKVKYFKIALWLNYFERKNVLINMDFWYRLPLRTCSYVLKRSVIKLQSKISD